MESIWTWLFVQLLLEQSVPKTCQRAPYLHANAGAPTLYYRTTNQRDVCLPLRLERRLQRLPATLIRVPLTSHQQNQPTIRDIGRHQPLRGMQSSQAGRWVSRCHRLSVLRRDRYRPAFQDTDDSQSCYRMNQVQLLRSPVSLCSMLLPRNRLLGRPTT